MRHLYLKSFTYLLLVDLNAAYLDKVNNVAGFNSGKVKSDLCLVNFIFEKARSIFAHNYFSSLLRTL